MNFSAISVLVVCPIEQKIGLGKFYEIAFQSLGCKVSLFGLEKTSSVLSFNGVRERVRSKISGLMYKGLPPDIVANNLIQFAQNIKPDLIVVIRCERLQSNTINKLNEFAKIGCVNIYPDHPFVIPGRGAVQLAESLQHYSVVFTFGQNLVPIFYQLGAKNVKWLPFAYSPKIHYHLNGNSEFNRQNISYFGQWGPLQEHWIKPLASQGLSIYGGDWDYVHRASPLSHCWRKGEGLGINMARAISSSKIVFNLVRAEAGCMHSMKTFEIPACGGFMLTNWTEEQALFFKDERDVVFFKSIDEMIEKVKYYSFNDAERERIRLAGMKAVAPHTYESRVRVILEYLETGLMNLII